MKTLVTCLFLLAASLTVFGADDARKLANYLQGVSVTIKSEAEYSRSEGSGALFYRKVDGNDACFVWTAAHVIENARRVREVIDKKGSSRKVVEFTDPQIVREITENGRRVGEMKMDAKVIKYSNATTGHDLALLYVRTRNFSGDSVKFYDDNATPVIAPGTYLLHCGSLLGQLGAGSLTDGIMSQVGRTYRGMLYDQTSVTSFPGSSGGGVYLRDGRYVGMVVRGAGEGFNLIVPIRRLRDWATEHKLTFALDKNVPVTEADLAKIPVEDSGIKGASEGEGARGQDFPAELRKLPRIIQYPRKSPLKEK